MKPRARIPTENARTDSRPNAVTRDALFGGRVVLHQPASGYRVNVDAPLLAAFATRSAPAEVAVDLGAGTGAVGLALLHLKAAERVLLVEADADAAAMARTNLAANGWSARGDVLHADVGTLPAEASADLVVCNPPYVPPGQGRVPSNPARARGRSGDLGVFVLAARRIVRRRARTCFVYPAHAIGSLFELLRATGLEPKRMRTVHATAGAPARIVLVEARAGKPGGLEVEPPLVERDAGGYSAELRALLCLE